MGDALSVLPHAPSHAELQRRELQVHPKAKLNTSDKIPLHEILVRWLRVESAAWSKPLMAPPWFACRTIHFKEDNCLTELKDGDRGTGN